MAKYYVMECYGKPPIADIDPLERYPGGPWISGRVKDVPSNEQFKYEINEDYPGILKTLYLAPSVPLMHKKLAEILSNVGVDNIQYFNAEIADPETNEINRDYKAFNVVGLVSATDMEKSTKMHDYNMSSFDNDFDKLVLDHDRIHDDLLLFRLAENINAIVVHEKIKELVEEADGLKDMRFLSDGEWAG